MAKKPSKKRQRPTEEQAPATKKFKASPEVRPSSRPDPNFLQDTMDKLRRTRAELPIWKDGHRVDLKMKLRKCDLLIIVGDTGSGKSTQVPQFLSHEAYNVSQMVKINHMDSEGRVREKEIKVGGIIGVTEPRRVAVTSLAHRVAIETGSYIGKGMTKRDAVGYAIRFDSQEGPAMRIKFQTEGMLVAEMMTDKWFTKYSVVIVDEVHERSVDCDLILGQLKWILHSDLSGRGGVPLKVVIMSATAEVEKIKEFFESPLVAESLVAASEANKSSSKTPSKRERIKSATPEVATISKPIDAQIVRVKGQLYNVEEVYHKELDRSEWLEKMEWHAKNCHITEAYPGDLLCFLPGQEDIRDLEKRLEDWSKEHGYAAGSRQKDKSGVPAFKVVPLYGQMSMDEQKRAFESAGSFTRKIILATNIAEASITVPGVKYVLDSGKVKQKAYHPELRMETLLVKNISKSSAKQRQGRAGRMEDGKVIKMYTRADFKEFEVNDAPEILRTNITSTVLKMKVLGIKDPFTFNWISPPTQGSITTALETLLSFKALNEDGDITELGRKMNKFPISPEYALVLLSAAKEENDCLLEAIDVIAALTCGEDIFVHAKDSEGEEKLEASRQQFQRREGDVITYLTAMRSYMAEPKSQQLDWCKQHSLNYSNMKTALNIRSQLIRLCVSPGLRLLTEEPPPLPQPFSPPTEEEASSLLYVTFLLKEFPYKISEARLEHRRSSFSLDEIKSVDSPLKSPAFADETALIHPDGKYHVLHGDKSVIHIHPTSVLQGKKMEAIMFLQHVFTSKNFAKKVSRVHASWIEEALTRKWS